jgi:hypothetical protein
MDPVPNGPIFIPGSDDVHSVEIFNQSSLIADHTSYASNQEEFLLPIADAIVQHSGTDLKISPVLGSTRMLAKRIHRIRNTAKQIDNVFLLLALLAFLLNREAMEATGSFLIGWIDAGCDKGVGNCWRYSARVTGSGAALIVFLFFRLCVEGCHSIPVTMMKDLFRDFEPWVQWSLRSHAFACLILSFALALQYPHTFGWIGWAYGLVPDVYLPRSSLIAPSPWSVQATVFGIVGAIALYGFDSIRVSRLLKSWRHAREAEAKVMAAKK